VDVFSLFHNQVIPCSWEPEALVTMVLDADLGSISTYPIGVASLMESTGAADDDLSWWSVIFEKFKNRGR